MRRVSAILLFSLVSISVLLGGCSTFSDFTLTKRSEIEKQITAARVETEAKIDSLNQRQFSLLNDTIAAHNALEQAAANYLFKGLATYGSLREPTRPEMVMGQSIKQTATQLPPATAEAQLEALKALQIELDEARISNEALRAQYEEELNRAQAEGEAKSTALKTLSEQIQQAEKEKVEVLSKAAEKERELQSAKDTIQDAATAAAKQDVERAKSVQALKLKTSAITGGLALLCLAGAIWSPIAKPKFALGAAIMGLATVGIWYIQPWHVLLAVGVCVLGLIGWAAKNHYIESRAATNVYRAIQSVKDNARDDYERVIKPKLEEWNTVYTSNGKTAPDTAAVKHIDNRLREVGDL